jgi:hypothetical protein
VWCKVGHSVKASILALFQAMRLYSVVVRVPCVREAILDSRVCLVVKRMKGGHTRLSGVGPDKKLTMTECSPTMGIVTD